SMKKIDGFQTTDSFRFDRNSSSSSISLSSSSGYGSRLSLFQTDPSSSSSNRRIGITKYIKEKLSRHKSLASLLLSSSSTTTIKRTEINNHNTDIYDNVWNLDEQIEKFRLNINKQIQYDSQSIISMSVDTPKPIRHRIDDQDLLSAAAWYQEGLPEYICEEYLNNNNQPIGSFIIRCNYNRSDYPYMLSIKTNKTSIEHFFIQQIINNNTYRIKGSSKTFVNLSTLVIHHTVIRENLPVTLVLPFIHSTLNSQQPSSLGIIRSVRF
ncbi:unnamed protein product, partial [Rotaria sp. Silwood2]